MLSVLPALSGLPSGLPCPLRTVTGLDCPLCGATRATLALLRGDMSAALDYNALYVVLLPLLAVLAVVWLTQRRQPLLVQAVLRSRAFPPVAIGAAVAYMVVRNLPFAPFDYLGT